MKDRYLVAIAVVGASAFLLLLSYFVQTVKTNKSLILQIQTNQVNFAGERRTSFDEINKRLDEIKIICRQTSQI